MGTAKKLTLTAGVAVLVAFAFMVGFVPAHDAATSRAADSEGRVDMAGLLDMIVGGEKAIEAITPSVTISGLNVNDVNVVVPVNNAVAPNIVANIASLTAGSPAGEQVFYVLNGAFLNDTDRALPFWTGALADVIGFSGSFADPDGSGPRLSQGTSTLVGPAYEASLDLWARAGGGVFAADYVLNALAVATSVYGLYQPGVDSASVYFDEVNIPLDPVAFGFDVVAGADTNNNAIPDSLAIIGSRTLWLANNSTGIGGGVRDVLVASLDLADAAKGLYDTVVLNPAGGVTVTLPTTDALKTAGVVDLAATQVLAMVSVADSLAAVVDNVDGDAGEAARTAWAELAAKGDPEDAPVVDIALLVNTGGSYSLLTNIAPLAATISVMTGDISPAAVPGLIVAGVPTVLAGGVLTNGDPADWHVADAAPVVDTGAAMYTATVDQFSAFVLLTPRYMLTTSAVGDGTVTPDPEQPVNGYLVNETVSLLATAASGYKFDFWSGDVTGTVNPVNVVMDADKAVVANFSPISAVNYTVTVNPSVGGTVDLDPNLAQYPDGSTVTVTAVPDPDYAFVAWTDDLTGVLDNPASLVVNSDKTVGAVFAPVVKYTVTIDPLLNGTVALDPAQPAGGYVENTTVTVTATADAGFRFDEWTGALAGQPNPATLVMDGDKTVGAAFLRNTVLTESDPAEIPSNVSVPMILKGVFPTGKSGLVGAYQGLTRAEAEGRYEVYVNNTLANFREVAVDYGFGTGDFSVTAIDDNDPAQTNEMYITSPVFDIADKAAVTVQIVDLSDPNNTQTFTNIVTAVQYGVVTLTYSGSGAGTTTLVPASSTLIIGGNPFVLPAGTFAPGTLVTALVAPDAGSVFATLTYAGNPVNGTTFTVQGGPADLDTKYDDANQQYTLTLTPTVNGTLAAAPVQATYTVNSVVALTATPATGYAIAGWTGNTGAPDFVVDPVAFLTATVKMTGDKTIGVTFKEEGTGPATRYSLRLLPVTGGVLSVDLAAPANGYLPGTVVNVTATANTGYVFTGWALDLAGTANPAALTMDDDKVVGAVFTPIAVVPLTLSGISASEAWIFGGVTAKLTGTGLTLGTQVTVGGKAAVTWNAAADGTSVDLLIPASDDNSTAALVPVQVVAAKGAETAALPFTYKRYVTDAEGRNLTAFILNDPGAGNTVGVTIGVDNLTQAELTIPSLDAQGRVYGIVLNQRLELAAAKATTAAVPAGSLASALIDAPGDNEGTIGGGYDFSVHLFTDPAGKATTPPVEAQVPWLQDANALIDFAPAVSPDGVPTASGMLLTFPLPLAQLTYGDVRTGLKWFGIESQFNYVSNSESYTDPKVVAYQSEVLAAEVDAPMTCDTADVARPDQVLKNRLYSLNGFSLRKGALLPDEVAAQIRLAKVDGKAVNGTGKGTRKGGTQLTLVSPDGGLGYVDRIVLKPSAKCFNKEAGGTASGELLISNPGDSEYVFDFKTPKSKKTGVVDLVIYLKSDPTTPAATLTDVYEYQKPKTNWLLIILIILGVAAAAGGIIAATA